MGCACSTAEVASRAPTMSEMEKSTDFYSQYPKNEAGYTVTQNNVPRAPIFSKVGFASEKMCPPTTLIQVAKDSCAKLKDFPVLKIEEVDTTPPAKGEQVPPSVELDKWKTWTYGQYYDDSECVARAFIKLGMKRFDAISIYGFNHPAWHMSAMGAVLGCGIVAGIYPTDTPEQVLFKVKHSGAVVAVVENVKKMETFLSLAGELPDLKAIVVWDHKGADLSSKVSEKSRSCMAGSEPAEGKVKCMTWEELVAMGKKESSAEEQKQMEGWQSETTPGHCCAYIYTSGTTGMPKAVMISHDNIVFESRNAAHVIAQKSPDGERIISYLPLSHVAGMMVDIICPLLVTNPKGCCVCFARSYDLKTMTLGERLKAVRPTLFLGVPRVWEKIQEKMMAMVAANPPTGVALMVARTGKEKGLAHQLNCQMGGSGAKECCHCLAEKVGNTVRARLGLDACNFAFTGAAPVKRETQEYFGALGININEVYGMSECTGATTWSTDEAHVWASCGWPMHGCEVAIMNGEKEIANPNKEDKENPMIPNPDFGKKMKTGEAGEVCFRGRHVMLGYMANPALGADHVAEIEKKNKETIDEEGWLHSGDKGTMDALGMVRITGRYKELIIGAGGENVAPVPVEDGIKSRCAAISNVMMVGDQRKFNVCVITLKAFGTGELPGGNDLEPAAQAVCDSKTVSAAMDDKKLIDAITKAITDTNADTACCPMPPSRVQKFTILPLDFSAETSELTPTFKLKRSVANKKYLPMLDHMYESADSPYVRYKEF